MSSQIDRRNILAAGVAGPFLTLPARGYAAGLNLDGMAGLSPKPTTRDGNNGSRSGETLALSDADAPLQLPSMPLHDPWIVADIKTKTYFLFTRNDARVSGENSLGVMAYRSKDLKNWSKPAVVFKLPVDNWANDGAWAPEVHLWNGKWYMFVTFHNEALPLEGAGRRPLYRRSTILAAADRLAGPFSPVRAGAPIVDASRMTLDGTLYLDRKGKPWLVYSHEWLQTTDGTIEAVPLDNDLAPIGDPKILFHGSAARWADGKPQKEGDTIYVTDGPELFTTRTGTLLMLWSSYDKDGYVQGLARSTSGNILGPWEQLPPLVRQDSGHGMLFQSFDGSLMMVLHRPFKNARGKLYVMKDIGESVEIVREATELDGDRG